MTPEQQVNRLHRRCDQLERMVTHQKEFIQEKDLKNDFFDWLTHKVYSEELCSREDLQNEQ